MYVTPEVWVPPWAPLLTTTFASIRPASAGTESDPLRSPLPHPQGLPRPLAWAQPPPGLQGVCSWPRTDAGTPALPAGCGPTRTRLVEVPLLQVQGVRYLRQVAISMGL